LKFGKGTSSSLAEDPVDTSGIEPKCREDPLQFSDVVTSEHLVAVVQEAVAETEPGFDEGRPGLRSTDTVNP
jgi:hypothetical protein